MKIIAKEKHSPYNITYTFENKSELVEYAERRYERTGEKDININRASIYELLEYCHLKLFK